MRALPYPWLQTLAQQLHEMAEQQRLPHALLLAGPPGWGQTELADWLTCTLLGLDSDAPVMDLAHPDLRWLVPDGAMIKVDQVRSVAAFAVGTRQSAPCKVAVLDQAHAMNEQAANALLKTLEEPPAHTYLLLATEYASSLLPTIRSRCQRFDVRPDSAVGDAWIREHCGQQASELAFEYGGAPLAVRAAVERQERPLGSDLLAALGGQVQLLQQTLNDAHPATVLLRWLRYLVAELSGQSRLAPLQALGPRQLLAFQQELIAAQRQFVGSNSVNHKLQLERLALRFAALPSSK